ncbi:MAG: DoxX family protein, partial [Deltaproteobacteria bacterium]
MTTTLDTNSSSSATPSKALHVGLWIVQCLGGFAFTMAGAMKSTQPLEALAVKMTWIHHFPAIAVRGIGVAEFLGGLGLILPSALHIQPKLTPLAAVGLGLLMLGAAGTHVVLGEAPMMMPSL